MTSLRDDLIEFLAGSAPGANLSDDTSLIRSGRLDSSALFSLILWIEERAGAPVDVVRVNVRTELDTVEDIVRYIEARKPKDRGAP